MFNVDVQHVRVTLYYARFSLHKGRWRLYNFGDFNTHLPQISHSFISSLCLLSYHCVFTLFTPHTFCAWMNSFIMRGQGSRKKTDCNHKNMLWHDFKASLKVKVTSFSYEAMKRNYFISIITQYFQFPLELFHRVMLQFSFDYSGPLNTSVVVKWTIVNTFQ